MASYTKMFTSNAKRLDGSSSSMDFVDGSADAATAPVIDVVKDGSMWKSTVQLAVIFVVEC